jgi:hypothetical protein
MQDLARVFEVTRRYAAGARFFADAFAAQPKLLADGHTLRYQAARFARAKAWEDGPLRYIAARFAARAGCGQGADAATLDEKERARLRHQALAWLRDELSWWTEEFRQPDRIIPPSSWAEAFRENPAVWAMGDSVLWAGRTREAMRAWLSDHDLRCVRNPWLSDPEDRDESSKRGRGLLRGIGDLPTEERQAWMKLWADVETLKKKALAKRPD